MLSIARRNLRVGNNRFLIKKLEENTSADLQLAEVVNTNTTLIEDLQDQIDNLEITGGTCDGHGWEEL